MDPSVRIAMWSGPRNISTAMMRAWGNRPDTTVIDEPLYAFYLHRTHADHPGREEVISAGEIDLRKVIARLTKDPLPDGKCVFYQKHMTHHLLPEIDRDFLQHLTNCLLIRDPVEVIASYIKKNHEPSIEDLGFVQQAEIFDLVSTRGTPPVIDARDMQENPAKTLGLLCAAIGIDYTEAMLSWAPGRRDTDGVWAKYWYAEVEKSTGFQPPRGRGAQLPERLRSVHEQAHEIYERLRVHKLH